MLDKYFSSYSRYFDNAYHKYMVSQDILKTIENSYLEPISGPILNEMKCIGFHLLQMLQSNENDKEKLDSIMAETIDHCNRLVYDAYEMIFLLVIQDFSAFTAKYAFYDIGSVIPNWIDIKSRIAHYQDFISENNKKKVVELIDCSTNIEESQLHSHYKDLNQIRRTLFFSFDELEIKRRKYYLQLVSKFFFYLIIPLTIFWISYLLKCR
jgi:hypothetical protein